MGLYSANKSKDQLLDESTLCFINKNYSEAKSLLNKALTKALTPNEQYPILHLLGTCFLNLKDYKMALQYYNKALDTAVAIDKEIVKDTYYLIGIANYYLNEFANSIDYLSKYIEINPQFILAHRFRGECYKNVRKYLESIHDLELYFGDTSKILITEDNFMAVMALSISYIETDQIVKGTLLLLKAAEKNPKDVYVIITLRFLFEDKFFTDNDTNATSLLLKGKLYSQITNHLNSEISKKLVRGIELKFIDRLDIARAIKPELYENDIYSVGCTVSRDLFETWEKSRGSINSIEKAYLVFELAKVIVDFNLLEFEVDKLHKKLFFSVWEDPEFNVSKVNQDELVFVWSIPEFEMKNIILSKKFENIWARESGTIKYTLFLMIYSNEASVWYGDSKEKKYYHCKLRRLILTEGEYTDGIPRGVYEFEIVNIPDLDFSQIPDLKHIGEVFYVDREIFDVLFVIPVYGEDIYDYELKNTIGLEDTKFK